MIPRFKLMSNFISHGMVDSFEHGCDPDTATTIFVDIPELISASPLKVMQRIASITGASVEELELNACGDTGRIDAQVMTSKAHQYSAPRADTLKKWQKGERNLYSMDASFSVETEVEPGVWVAIDLDVGHWILTEQGRLDRVDVDVDTCIALHVTGYKYKGSVHEALDMGYLSGSPEYDKFISVFGARIETITVDGNNLITAINKKEL